MSLFTAVVRRRAASIVFVLLATAGLGGSSSRAETRAAAPAAMPEKLPPLREQDRIRQEWLKLRLERVLPGLMREHGVHMWLVVNREYAEDPVYFSLASPSTMAARRRTILVFFDRGEVQGVERLALGGGSHGGLYEVYRDPAVEARELWGQGQWALLRKLVEERQPRNIAIDVSHGHAFSDGLTAGEKEQLEQALGPWKDKLVRAEELPLRYIEARLPEMLPTWQQMQRTVHALIARAFSREVITPGVTTTDDVVWWLRQSVNDMGYGEWFPPSVSVQRAGRGANSPIGAREAIVIQPGDHLHTDFGIHAMGLATDTQHVGYVLKPGEADAPAGLQLALRHSNRLQDLVMERMRPGRTGNEVLADALAAMKALGIEGTVYSHPIGDHGHGAGPLIGLWDRQEGVPVRGDVKLRASTWFSIELQATTPVPEWGGQAVRSAQEEDAVLGDDGHMRWALGRQEKYHLVR
ncbi:MAG: aminopeptidase P family protein [Vicinamibacteria bacterium]|nr:aminopeptidase P family protein [Vicinamibacteria bacterium]